MEAIATETAAETTMERNASDANTGWNAIFLSWAWLRRAETIADELGIESVTVQYFHRGTPFVLTLWKYLLQAVHSFVLCLWRRPRVVFVTNPPVFAVLPVWFYTALFRTRFVVDFHTGCFLEGPWKRWRFLQRYFARRAALNLAHNDENAKILAEWGVSYRVLPSLPPRLAVGPVNRSGERSRVVYICSFKDDEPVEAFLEAAAALEDVDVCVTGKAPGELAARLPPNVRLTGYLSEKDYLRLLSSADVLVALTTREDTLLYGAQEAIALHRPLVLTGSDVLRRYFPSGAVFSENSPEALGCAVRSALESKERLVAEIIAFESECRASGRRRLREIRALLGE